MKKKVFIIVSLLVFCMISNYAQEYLILTSVESIIPGGLGRSRLIENREIVESEKIETVRTDGIKSEQSKIDRRELKVDHFAETKLLNFYSMTGINFRNIASNDAIISDKLSLFLANGWTLKFVTSGVHGGAKGQGIFITRYVLYRE